MQRDPQQFPADENGDVLWQMALDGDDLTEIREIDFTLIFPDQSLAEQSALHLLRQEQKVSLYQEDEEGDLLWEVVVHITMPPDYAEIVEIETWLKQVALQFSGQYDGWGCMAWVDIES